jgi:hypothetical protein
MPIRAAISQFAAPPRFVTVVSVCFDAGPQENEAA